MYEITQNEDGTYTIHNPETEEIIEWEPGVSLPNHIMIALMDYIRSATGNVIPEQGTPEAGVPSGWDALSMRMGQRQMPGWVAGMINPGQKQMPSWVANAMNRGHSPSGWNSPGGWDINPGPSAIYQFQQMGYDNETAKRMAALAAAGHVLMPEETGKDGPYSQGGGPGGGHAVQPRREGSAQDLSGLDRGRQRASASYARLQDKFR